MKAFNLPFLLFLSIGLLTWSGCTDDDVDDLINEVTLNYDSAPDSAPFIDANMYAVWFPNSEVSPFADRDLETVRFQLEDFPPTVIVRVFEAELVNDEPTITNEIYEQNITQRVNAVGTFIEHRLTTPVDLSNRPNGIWIGIETGIAPGNRIQSIACDAPGNGNINGQWVRIGDSWGRFTDLGGEDVDWNIRGILSPAE